MLGLIVLLGSGPALARRQSLFDISLARDLTLLGGGLVLWITPGLVGNGLPSRACDPCDRRSLSWLDRPVVSFSSEPANKASDALVVLVPTLAVAGSLLDLRDWGWRGVGEDVLLIAQAMALSGSLQQVVSFAVRRPRPFMYRATDEPGRDTMGANTSFYSGHTSTVFAAASAFATIFTLRHRRSDLRPLVWLASMLVAATMPLCRVASGEHFWSDVLAGAAAGTGVGILVPVLHRRTKRLSAGAGGLRLAF